jgi:light-independent protochlorophyllide reductase subunit B
MGAEGANVLFDTWVHPLMMGLEEHLLAMFREDFEFHEGAAPSHLGRATAATTAATAAPEVTAAAPAAPAAAAETAPAPAASAPAPAPASPAIVVPAPWAPDAERELQKIPFFVRGKARRNTERFAADRGLATITVETLYDAKAHFSR